MNMIFMNGREVELPESGKYSAATTYFLLPSYKLNDQYTSGMRFRGLADYNDSSKSELKEGSANITKAASDISDFLTYSPALVGAFPVNPTQRNIKSFIGAIQGNVTFATKKDAIGTLSLSATFGATKSFYEYSTELNLKPDSDEIYNSDYSVFESVTASHPLFGNLGFGITFVNKQAWDFEGESKYIYDLTETLTWKVNSVFSILGGLDNEEAVKASESDLIYRFYNGKTSAYFLGFSLSI
jgi:hypothetical protein